MSEKIYATLPARYYVVGNESVWSAGQMRAFADATHALRTQALAAQAPVTDLQNVHDAVTVDLLNERVAYLEAKLKEAQVPQQVAPTRATISEMVPFVDKSTADPVEKARRYLTAMGDNHLHSTYFFDDGFPKQESASDALATLAILEQLAAPQQEVQEPVLFVSPGQLAKLEDPLAPFGKYLPARKTSAGMFTQPLYTAQPAPSGESEDGEHTNAELLQMLDESLEEKKKCYLALGQHQMAISNLIAERDALKNAPSGGAARAWFDAGWKAAPSSVTEWMRILMGLWVVPDALSLNRHSTQHARRASDGADQIPRRVLSRVPCRNDIHARSHHMGA